MESERCDRKVEGFFYLVVLIATLIIFYFHPILLVSSMSSCTNCFTISQFVMDSWFQQTCEQDQCL